MGTQQSCPPCPNESFNERNKYAVNHPIKQDYIAEELLERDDTPRSVFDFHNSGYEPIYYQTDQYIPWPNIET